MTSNHESVRIICVFVSSPGDVAEERAVLDEVVASINRTDGQDRGYRLELFKWEESVTPRIGPKPQEVVDEQTPPYDVYLGIMSTRFGSGGTESEFRDAMTKWEEAGEPWVTFYFKAEPKLSAEPEDALQYVEVCKFRKELEKQGIVATYAGVRGSKDGFYEQVSEHLRKIARQFLPPEKPLPGAEPPISDCIEYYLKCLTEETKTLTMLGMGRSLQVELPIEEAYVPLQTTLTRSLETKETWRFQEGRADHEEVVDLGDIFRKATILGLRGVILLGEPGSGKTTGARQLVWRLSSGQSRPEDLGLPAGVIPVFLRFRNLSRDALDERNGLHVFLEEEARCDEAPAGYEMPGTDLWNRGRLLWVLDGLDEVIDPSARKKVSGWISRALTHRPDDWFVVTCRFQGYYREGVPLGPNFVEFHVRPLEKPQVDRFVRDWFGAAHRKLQGPGKQAETRAKADSSQLLDILTRPAYQTGHMRELCTNPLLLTILCIVFHEERKLPMARAELYAHCVRVLLEYWRRDLYESQTGLKPYDAEAAQSVLAGVAWWMHAEQDRTAAPLDELARVAEVGLAEVSPSSGLGLDGRAFLERMRDEAGILAMDREGRCGYLHLSFQEYLAAEHAAREGKAKELASRAVDSWWREVALLSLRRSRPFCEEFFKEMLHAGIAENYPELVDRCLQESLYFVPGPFVYVLNRSKRKHRVAAVLRLLRDRAVQVPDLERICHRLADSDDEATRGFTREILNRLGATPKAAVRGGDVFVDERTGITFVAIPGGEFRMGSLLGRIHEQPVHRVTISRDYLLGKYPVTNAQYERFLKDIGDSVREPEGRGNRRFNQPDQPVVGVSWDDARAFCEWADARLPTEAEWEYACRAGNATEYSFGDDAEKLGEYGWFEANSGGQTQPVGAKKPSPWGVHDMHGNIWEWCHDWYGPYSSEEATDPTEASDALSRVLRGGCWRFGAGSCRSACRNGGEPVRRIDTTGFRVAADPPAQSSQQPTKRSGAGNEI